MVEMPPSRALFAVDIKNSTKYPGSSWLSLRQALHEVVWSSLEHVGISRHEDVLGIEDAGDGFAIILGDRDTARLVDAVPKLNNELHQRAQDFDPPLRMRAVVHHGPIHPSGSGTARIELARMLESNELRKVLEDTGSKLAVMISDHAYHTTVEDGYTEAVKPLDFRPMDIRVKNAEIKVRVYTPAPPSDLTKRRGVAVAVSAIAAASKYPKRKDASAIPPEKGTTAPRNRKIRMTSAKTNISHGQPFPERPRRTASTATVGSPLGSPLSSHAHMPPSRAMIAVDIEQYSGYPDFLRPSIRQAMCKIVGSALEQVGISWDPVERDDKVYSRDDGDGFTIILSDRDTARLVDAVPELNNELHRRARDFDPPLRMRAAIHHGPIDHSGSGIARIELARMLGSNELRKALENTDSRFAVMISDHAYHTAVEGGYTAAVKPHNFQPVDIQVKKLSSRHGYTRRLCPPT